MRAIAGASSALVLAAVLTACGGSDAGSGTSGSNGSASDDASPSAGASDTTSGGAESPRFPLQFRTVACAVPTSELGRGIAEACGLSETVCDSAPGPTPPDRRLSTCEELTGAGTAYQLEPAAISGGVESAEAVNGDGGWVVEVELGAQEGDVLADLTGELARRGGGQVALVLDGEVIIAPEVVSPVEGGRLSIEGGFDEDDASRLAGLLAAGG